MASSENTSSRSGIGWMPKLILWSVVIAFGYLYLSSIDRDGDGKSSVSSLLESVAKLSPIPISALPGFSESDDEADAAKTTASTEAPEASAGAAEEHVSTAESAVFAKSLMKQEAAEPKPEPETAATPVRQPQLAQPAQYPAPPSRVEPKKPELAPAPEGSVADSSPAAPEAQPAPAAAPSPAPVASAPMPAMPAMPAPGRVMPPVASQVPAAPAQGSVPQDWEAMQKQREELVSQLEAMRREADERMRAYWERMRTAAPSAPAAPYAYPGYYGPAYGPAYGAGAYAPSR